MSKFYSSSELARAKRMHTADMSLGSVANNGPPSHRGPYSDRVSHNEFGHDKARHLADIQASPPRDRPSPTPREELTGPPYHQSCRGLAQEVGEHMTPLYPTSTPRGRGDSADHLPHTSNEEMTSEIRRHRLDLDSVQRSRSRERGEGGDAAPGSAQCSSNARFTTDKALHRHGMDDCCEHGHHHGHDDHDHGACTSLERLRKRKAAHSHELDECRGKHVPEYDDTPHDPEPLTSNEQLGREIRRHHHELDSIQRSRRRGEQVDDEGHHGRSPRCSSNTEFASQKRNHKHGMDECCEHGHRHGQGHGQCEGGGACISNSELARRKVGHGHQLDECRGPRGSPHNREPEAPTSNEGLRDEIRRHRHEHDSVGRDRSGRGAGRADEGSAGRSPRCMSNSKFTTDKALHRHGMDDCCEHGHHHGHDDHDHGACTSHSRLRREKVTHRHQLDECRPHTPTPQRDSSQSPHCTSNSQFSSQKRSHRHGLDDCHHHDHDHEDDHTL